MKFPPLPPEDLDHVLQHTGKLWEELRGQRLFITGGTGFFGMWLLESFARANDVLNLGASAVILTRDPAAFAAKAPHLARRPDLGFLEGDIRTFPFPAGRFPFVIHAAAEASAKMNAENPGEMRDVIVAGTCRVLDFAVRAGVRKLLFTSSGAVYGRQPSELTHTPEDYSGTADPLWTDSAYGAGKRVAEQMCTEHARQYGFDVKTARCFAFVGPHLPLDAHFAIGNFIRDALAGGAIRVTGDGTPRRSYLYAADLAIWLWTILLNGVPGRAYNTGSPHGLSVGQIAAAVAAAVSGSKVERARRSSMGMMHAHYVPDVRRAEAELGLRVCIPLSEAINKTIKWHRAAHY